MEEMNNVIENGAIEVVEEVTEKLSFKENCIAYGIAGIFGIGVVTTGYLAFKGGKKLYDTIKDKKKIKEESEQEEVVDVEEDDIQEDFEETDQD